MLGCWASLLVDAQAIFFGACDFGETNWSTNSVYIHVLTRKGRCERPLGVKRPQVGPKLGPKHDLFDVLMKGRSPGCDLDCPVGTRSAEILPGQAMGCPESGTHKASGQEHRRRRLTSWF